MSIQFLHVQSIYLQEQGTAVVYIHNKENNRKIRKRKEQTNKKGKYIIVFNQLSW